MRKILIFLLCFFCEISANEWKRVYLATYPRSGNHWMRFLLEEATQIATGSVYKDQEPPHLPNTFEWGGYSPPNGYTGKYRYPEPGDTVIIKTHYPAIPVNRFDKQPYFKVIRVIRHPVDSFYSYYVMMKSSSPIDFHIQHFIDTWKNFQEYWNNQPNVLNVRYEDVLAHPEESLQLILESIGYDIPESTIKAAVNAYPPQGGELKHVDKFTKENLDYIESQLKSLMEQFNYKMP